MGGGSFYILKGRENNGYKERFKAEYYQTNIRYQKLHAMTTKY